MKTLRLACGKEVSEIGFGCWQLGLKGWGMVDECRVVQAVQVAREGGVKLFDTAAVYGFGRSEELLGDCLRGAAEEVVIITKGGLVWDARGRVRHDNRPKSLRAQLEASLRRLGRETLDVYLLHWPDEAVSLKESVAALEAFRTEGLIRQWGVSNQPRGELESLAESRWGVNPLVEVTWNLLGEDQADLLGAARREGFDAIAYDVLARGLLAGRYDAATRFGRKDVRRRDPRYVAGRFERNLERVEALSAAALALREPPASLAIRAVLELSGAGACIVGMKTPEQVRENLRAAEIALPEPTLRVLNAMRDAAEA